MGWSIPFNGSASETIANKSRGWNNEDSKCEVLKTAITTEDGYTCLWIAGRVTLKKENRIDSTILLYLITSDGGYKDICESMRPCYYSCPLELLDITQEISPTWRNEVRKYHGVDITAGVQLTMTF